MHDTPRPETVECLRRLIGFDTVSTRSNLQLIGDVAERLEALGFSVDFDRDATGQKANLVARVGPECAGGLLLAGHSDVVPVEGQSWSSDPFKAVIRDGRIYGRGACDMKGYFGAILGLLPSIDLSRLARPLYLAFTYDEEVGCFGAQSLVKLLSALPHRPARCIVGEPTGMAVVLGHKGKLSVDCTVHGVECHSAYNTEGVNAVEIASELVVRLRQMQTRIRRDGPLDDRFNPPHTTIHTGSMHGGTARNIVPRTCGFQFEIRNLPGDDPDAMLAELMEFAEDALLPEMREVSDACGIEMRTQSNIPALLGELDAEFTRYLLSLSGRNLPQFVSFATEGGLYRNAGMETLICGPGHIDQAHKADEYVELAQLARCEAFLERVIRDFLMPPA